MRVRVHTKHTHTHTHTLTHTHTHTHAHTHTYITHVLAVGRALPCHVHRQAVVMAIMGRCCHGPTLCLPGDMNMNSDAMRNYKKKTIRGRGMQCAGCNCTITPDCASVRVCEPLHARVL